MWIILGLLVAVVVSLVWWSRWFHREAEMGSVSSQWLAEHRHNHDP
jgi:hypothetical protein